MSSKTNPTRARRMAREPQQHTVKSVQKTPSRLDQLEQLLAREGGASVAEMAEATGWQHHSIRGAMAAALKKRGLTISSEKRDGVRRYRAGRGAS